MHPTCVAWYLSNQNYGIINITSNLLDSGNIMLKAFESIADLNLQDIDKIAVEKPFLRLLGDNTRELAKRIIHIQRHFGMLLYILGRVFKDVDQVHVSSKVARDKIYKREINMDTQLSEARALLEDSTTLPPLQLLCLHDTLVLARYLNEFVDNNICEMVV